MPKTRFLMIGGFLGAGKTTAIARLARHFTDQGLRVGLVTNDQAYGLVDTESLRAQGFQVGEVPGACFCCKFDELVDTTAKLGVDSQPDIIITEPVGSCTDLMATVVHPLRHLHGDRYEIAPLVVLCKPEHGRKILSGTGGGFSPQAAYIFLKQLEEAQLVVLNKCDALDDSEQAELLELIHNRFPDKQVVAASARTGANFESILEFLAEDLPPVETMMDVDYDTYAEGEAVLGWLNAGVKYSSIGGEKKWNLDDLVQALVEKLSLAFASAYMEPGHVKVLASADGVTAVANWVASDQPVELSVASGANVLAADLLINARVHGDPNTVSSLVQDAARHAAREFQLNIQFHSLQHFRPGRPEPVHRYASHEG